MIPHPFLFKKNKIIFMILICRYNFLFERYFIYRVVILKLSTLDLRSVHSDTQISKKIRKYIKQMLEKKEFTMENSNLIYKLIAGTFHLHNGAGGSSNA